MTVTLDDILSHYRNGDRALIERAFALAEHAHQGQYRASGEPYISHPLSVAAYLADLGFDAPSIAAAMMHDVLEDTAITRVELERQFGPDVAFLVDGVTKLASIKYQGTAKDEKARELQVATLKKMFLAMAQDIRVIIIKLADRLHNMRTLGFKHQESRARKALETLEIYAPIAARLGMGRMKGELEDLAFPHTHPKEHAWLKKTIKGKYEDRLRYIERTAPIVRRHLTDAGITVLDVHARAKRMWSLYEKLQRYEMDPDKVMDLVAMRIIVPDVKSCYEALGIIHAQYRPMPGRIKDYIALAKPNGYRSLHTTVFCEKGRLAEIQIRTQEMHDHAEHGIAAHWAYSEAGKPKAVVAKQQELEWVNKLKSHLKDLKSSQGLADLKIDFFKNRIFVLTPQGDAKDLPEGATPVDFAYAVHSELGHRTTGALINGRIAPLSHPLQSGDVVEIIRGKVARPNTGWLRFIRTTQAAKHVRAWLKSHQPEPEKEKIEIKNSPTPLAPRPIKSTTTEKQIIIDRQHGLAYKLGKCCAPSAGTPVIGYLTISRGVTVHTAHCKNIKTAPKKRLLPADWN